MDYTNNIFGFDSDKLIQFAEPHTIERTARIESNRLIMESEIDRRILRREDLPDGGPQLDSGYPLLDWAFLIARRDVESNFYDGGIYAGEHFRHNPSWVRDTSITTMMGLALFYPEKMEEILLRLLDEKLGEIQFEQYRGFYEDRYFSMTDQILWVLAAEKLCRVRGDDSLLVQSAPYAAKTISRMLTERLDWRTFLFAGGSSLFDGHSGFPDGMTGPGLRSSSTNLIYLRALKILEDLGGMPERVRCEYRDLRDKLGQALDRELWLEDRGYYAQLHFGDNYREERLETLGNLIALGNPDLDAEKAQRIVAAIRQHPYGPPALSPWYEERIVYHSEGIWPFMMGFGLLALRDRREPISEEIVKNSGLDLTYVTAQLLRTSMLEGTFMELLHGRTGQGRYSPAQVWSAAAMLSVVESGIFGMQFSDDHLTFKPALPDFLKDRPVHLRNIVIRRKSCTLSVGPGLKVSVDGQPLPDNVLRFADWDMAAGKHDDRPIEIALELHLNATRDDSPPASGATASSKDWKLRASPPEITIFPGEEQIGSYLISLQLTNESDSDRELALRFESPGSALAVQPDGLEMSVEAGATATGEFRLAFDQPPVHFGGGALRISDTADVLRLEVPVRRFLTLDCSWRFKPMYKMDSVNYGREFRNFGSWDLLRVPMHAEFRQGAYEGLLWYAKKLVIPDGWAGEDLAFYCGAMSDWDITYFNGTVIGQTGSKSESAHGQERRYTIPAELVKFGAVNTIAVQLYCHGEENGMWKGPVFIALEDDVEWAKAFGRKVLEENYLPQVEEGGNATN